MARQIFATRIPREPVDVGVFSAYPKDSEYLQVGMAFNLWRSAPRPVVKDSGSVVACTAASEGAGFHSLIGPGRKIEASGGFPASMFAPRNVVVFSTGVTEWDLTEPARDGLTVSQNWDAVIGQLRERHGSGSTVAVFPWSAIQLADGDADE
jgi:hypothetical protein